MLLLLNSLGRRSSIKPKALSTLGDNQGLLSLYPVVQLAPSEK